ncbi:MAG: alpha/beta fold hydrolase, partial [Alphaproteobacteria bacterium]
DYITGPLDAAFAAAHQLCGGKIAIAGYCMGGLLALALAKRRIDDVSALVLLATPWDFNSYDPGKTRMLKAMTPNIEKMLDATGFMPVDVLQAMFASFDPNMTPRKFRAFAGLKGSSARARDFVALEDWLNDGVPLAGPTARDCLVGWYVDNLPDRGEWIMDGEPVRPQDIHVPSLVVIPRRDYIVPPASSEPLLRLLPDVTELSIDGGHIGMMVGSKAKGGLYTPLAKWLEKAVR